MREDHQAKERAGERHESFAYLCRHRAKPVIPSKSLEPMTGLSGVLNAALCLAPRLLFRKAANKNLDRRVTVALGPAVVVPRDGET